ncbi:MAG: Y-family DNA polymerase [Chitinophagaceae bacterium]|nr:Y-family DNA polymerase [Chitinophagaceae bacterium]
MKAIIDCNNFYCSCERLFRPELRNKPVVVLSNNDGCIVSRSDEAKYAGVPMAAPFFESRSIIALHDIAVFSSNYNLYGDLSWRVMETLRMIAGKENVEVYSVDEAFVDLSAVPVKELPTIAKKIKKTVEDWTGISVSIGVAPTKTLAKLANYIAKKDKKATGCITVLATRQEQQKALQQTRLANIWGVGGAYANKLYNMGIFSGWDLASMPDYWMYKNMGGVVGSRLLKELNGEPAKDMEEELVTKKVIATTRMFGSPVGDIASIREAVATYTSRAAEKLRRQHSAAKTISVFVVANEENHNVNYHGATHSDSFTLPAATSFTNELIKPAIEIVDTLYKPGMLYKKAGVMLSGIVPDNSIQANLFLPETKNCERKLMDMIDNVNFSQRDDVLKFAASGTVRNWKMQQNHISPRYTTRWNELYEVS